MSTNAKCVVSLYASAVVEVEIDDFGVGQVRLLGKPTCEGNTVVFQTNDVPFAKTAAMLAKEGLAAHMRKAIAEDAAQMEGAKIDVHKMIDDVLKGPSKGGGDAGNN